MLAASCKKEEETHLPTKPKLLNPARGAVVAPEQITFTWQASTDADGDDVYHSLALSSDSIHWQLFVVGTGTSKSIVNKSGESNYFAFENGKKYYWKVAVDSKDSKGDITGSSESTVSSFYTIPTGVSNLTKTSGNGFVNLAWTDPAGLSRVEVTFSPSVISIAQPIVINPGVGKVELQGMQNETIYSFYVKAFNNLGHASKVDTIKAMPLSPTLVHDYDFNIYSTVQIGTQTWLRENLKATHWQNGNEMKNEYMEKLYDIGSQSNIYGYYYTIDAAINGSQGKNPCPCGYHVPSDEDMKSLERFLGMTETDLNSTDYAIIRGVTENVGKSLKSTTGWNDYNGSNGNGNDLYGFNLLPAGYDSGLSAGNSAFIWTTTSPNGVLNFIRNYNNESNGVKKGMSGFGAHLSIRCVKD
jgi:uncharacterized protein (TIGR02145 family)